MIGSQVEAKRAGSQTATGALVEGRWLETLASAEGYDCSRKGCT